MLHTLPALTLMAAPAAWAQGAALNLTLQFSPLAAGGGAISAVPVGGAATWWAAVAVAGGLGWHLRRHRLAGAMAGLAAGLAVATALLTSAPVEALVQEQALEVALQRSPVSVDMSGAQRHVMTFRNDAGQAIRLNGVALAGTDQAAHTIWRWGAPVGSAPRCEVGLALAADASCTVVVAPRPQVGEAIQVVLKDLHPTQPSVGYDQIYYHLARKQPNAARFEPGTSRYDDYMKDTVGKRVSDYCADNGLDDVVAGSFVPETVKLSDASSFACKRSATEVEAGGLKTVVVGPGGQLYLTDGHHGFTTLWELADGGPDLPVWVRVTGDFSAAATSDAFWQQMVATGNAWLYDAQGAAITPAQLPAQLGLANLRDDAYRSLVYFTRDLGYSNSDVSEFAEFYWGAWLRQRVALTADTTLHAGADEQLQAAGVALADGALVTTGDAGYLALVRDASLAMATLNAQDVVAGTRTAADLGKLALPAKASAVNDWNDILEELGRNDIKQSGDSRKGGKAWYAKRYRQCGGPPSTQAACWGAAS
ncbi:hypothetical protein CCO03_06290 [Comamonas serinivorans]|uniref:Chromosome partitioning protein ParB n=1 Tax=Comamonas serinivorans TaxID=1082851 RepID=A0A1Y0EL20_9BURK|nr:hypothetical protein CCO03_06290 [Comamonas serinivorans]